MGDCNSDSDTTDKDTNGTNKSFSVSAEAFVMTNEQPDVSVEGQITDVSYYRMHQKHLTVFEMK
jgi:hypothetical protein